MSDSGKPDAVCPWCDAGRYKPMFGCDNRACIQYPNITDENRAAKTERWGARSPALTTTPEQEREPLSRDDRIAQLEARIYQLNRFVSAGRRAYNGKDFRILGEAIEVLNDQNRTIAAGTPEGARLVRSARAPEEGIHG